MRVCCGTPAPAASASPASSSPAEPVPRPFTPRPGADAKCDFIVKTLGATAAFNYKTQDWSQEVLKTTNSKGVDMVIDYIGADYFQKNLDVAARDAHIVCLGLMSGAKVKELDISQFLRKRLRVEGSSLRSRDPEYQGRLRDKLETYLPDFENGSLKVFVDKVFPWEQIQKAHEYLEGNTSTGKIICTVS